jgi:hypothetical protein
MEFKDKYTDNKDEATKKIISNDAYAIGEMISELINEIRHVRVK